MKSRLFLVTFLLVLWGGVTFGQGRGTEKRITASFSGIPLFEAIGTIAPEEAKAMVPMA